MIQIRAKELSARALAHLVRGAMAHAGQSRILGQHTHRCRAGLRSARRSSSCWIDCSRDHSPHRACGFSDRRVLPHHRRTASGRARRRRFRCLRPCFPERHQIGRAYRHRVLSRGRRERSPPGVRAGRRHDGKCGAMHRGGRGGRRGHFFFRLKHFSTNMRVAAFARSLNRRSAQETAGRPPASRRVRAHRRSSATTSFFRSSSPSSARRSS